MFLRLFFPFCRENSRETHGCVALTIYLFLIMSQSITESRSVECGRITAFADEKRERRRLVQITGARKGAPGIDQVTHRASIDCCHLNELFQCGCVTSHRPVASSFKRDPPATFSLKRSIFLLKKRAFSPFSLEEIDHCCLIQ